MFFHTTETLELGIHLLMEFYLPSSPCDMVRQHSPCWIFFLSHRPSWSLAHQWSICIYLDQFSPWQLLVDISAKTITCTLISGWISHFGVPSRITANWRPISGQSFLRTVMSIESETSSRDQLSSGFKWEGGMISPSAKSNPACITRLTKMDWIPTCHPLRLSILC